MHKNYFDYEEKSLWKFKTWTFYLLDFDDSFLFKILEICLNY